MSKPSLKEAIAALQVELEETRVFLHDLEVAAVEVKQMIESPTKGANLKLLKDQAIGIGLQASWWKAKQTRIEREMERKCAIRDRIFAEAKQEQLRTEAAAEVARTMAALKGNKPPRAIKKRAA